MRGGRAAEPSVLGRYEGIAAVYLFGSQQEDRAHGESDVDVGVLLDDSVYSSKPERFEARVRIATLLGHELAPQRPDVVILNDAPPTFAARVVTAGSLVLQRMPDREHAFRRDIQLRAADLEPFLRRTRRIKLRAILGQ